MRFPIIIHKDSDSEYGIIVPDFPGVFSGGHTLDEALKNTQEAIETLYSDNKFTSLPIPSCLEKVLACEDAQNGCVALIELDFSFSEEMPAPVAITIPQRIKNKIEKAACAQGMSNAEYLDKICGS